MSLKDELRRMVGERPQDLGPPKPAANINGEESALIWPDHLGTAGGGGGSASQAPALEGPLTEVPETRTYWPPQEVFDENGVVSVVVQALQSCKVADANGNTTTLFFTSPF